MQSVFNGTETRNNDRLKAVKKSQTNTGKNACATEFAQIVAQAFLPVWTLERFFHSFLQLATNARMSVSRVSQAERTVSRERAIGRTR